MRHDDLQIRDLYSSIYKPQTLIQESFNYVNYAEEILGLVSQWIQDGVQNAMSEVREKGEPLFLDQMTSLGKEADSLVRLAVLLKDGKLEKAKSAVRGLKKEIKDKLPPYILNLEPSSSQEIVLPEEPTSEEIVEPEIETEPEIGMTDEDLSDDNLG